MNALAFLLLTTFLWGLNYHWSKFLVTETSSYEAGVWRYVFAVLTLFLISIKSLPTKQDLKLVFKGIFLVGFIALFLFNYLFFKGMMLTSSLNAALIVGLNPALTLIISAIILSTSITIKQVAGILVAFCGVIFLIFKGDFALIASFNFSEGDLLIMASSCFFALHHVLVKKYSGLVETSKFTLLSAFMCLIPLVIVLAIKSDLIIDTDSNLNLFDVTHYTLRFWLSVVGIGCFGTGLAYWLWGKGIELTNAPKAAIFINFVPVSAAGFSLVLGDRVHSYHFISAAFILAGILFMQVNFKEIKTYFFK